MKKYRSLWFYLLLCLSLSLTILVIDVLNNSIIPKIVQDINSGVIGAILTTIITLILLSNQTDSQEKATKNSEVYKEKLKVFNEFLLIIGKSLEDGKLTASEIKNIIYSFSTLRIHISNENSLKIENALSLIDNEFFYVDENEILNIDKYIEFYTSVINVFRLELYEDDLSVQPLTNFNLSNLKHLTYKIRNYKIPCESFEDFIDKIQTFKQIYYNRSIDTPTIVFTIDEKLIEKLIVTYHQLNNIISKYQKQINFEFILQKYLINNNEYIALPYVRILYSNKLLAVFGISQKRRLHLTDKILTNGIHIFAIDPDDEQEIEQYETSILTFFTKSTELIDGKIHNP